MTVQGHGVEVDDQDEAEDKDEVERRMMRRN